MREDATTSRTRGRSTSPARLPPRPTRLIGREAEVAALQDLLLRDDVRLVTITGPPGVGKTRLAVEVAALIADRFAHEAAFIDLSGTKNATVVPFALAQRLGVQEFEARSADVARSILARITEFLEEKELLIVLDNLEQVISVAPVVADLLAACSNLKVLATSRIALHLLWEHEFPLSTLSVTDPDTIIARAPAVVFFAERAAAHQPQFTLSDSNAQIVAEICARLDGLPLAIELAAARVKHLTLDALRQRLDHSLDLLVGGAQDLPARQRTLRSAIAWIYDLLSPSGQALFRRLAVFQEGFTVEAAAAVTADHDAAGNLLDGIGALVDKSMVEMRSADGDNRYRMLESLREFALDRLAAAGEGDTVRARHAEFFKALAEKAEPEFRGPDQILWLDRLQRELGNIRAALQWTLEMKDGVAAIRIAASLRWLWQLRGYLSEGREWMQRALQQEAGAPPDIRSFARFVAGMLTMHMGDFAQAARLFEAGSRLAKESGDPKRIADGLVGMAVMALFFKREPDRAIPLYEEAMTVYRLADDTPNEAYTHWQLAWGLMQKGEIGRAKLLCEQGLALTRDIGDRVSLHALLGELGQILFLEGKYAEAAARFDERAAVSRELGYTYGLSHALQQVALVATRQGDYDRASSSWQQALALGREVGSHWAMAQAMRGLTAVEERRKDYVRAAIICRENLIVWQRVGSGPLLGSIAFTAARIATEFGRTDCAARLLATATMLGEEGPPLEPPSEIERLRQHLMNVLTEDRFRTEWERGRSLTLQEAADEAMAALEVPAAFSGEGLETTRPRRKLGLLSRREEEVATLIAHGLSNRAIAQRLFISERTADTHVQHILNKLGFNSRTQIAAWTVQHGLATPGSG